MKKLDFFEICMYASIVFFCWTMIEIVLTLRTDHSFGFVSIFGLVSCYLFLAIYILIKDNNHYTNK